MKITTGTEELARDTEIRQIEEDVRNKSVAIAKQQGVLADLGSVVEKRRFASITDPREAKFVMSWLFQKLSKDDALTQRNLEAKVNQQEEQIESLRKQLAAAESQIQSLTASEILDRSGSSLSTTEDHKKSCSREPAAPHEGHASLSEDHFKHKSERHLVWDSKKPFTTSAHNSTRKSNLAAVAKSIQQAQQVAADVLKSSQVKKQSAAPEKILIEESVGNISVISGDGIEDVELDETYDDPLDETFRSSDATYSDEDDEDYGSSRAKSKSRAVRKGSKESISGKKRSLSDIADDNDEVRSAKRLSPALIVNTSATKSNRRNSISGRFSEIALPLPFHMSSASAQDKEAKTGKDNRKLTRRASLSGTSSLSFVAEELSPLSEPLDSHTIPELKQFLLSRGLTVSG
jgi:hypothetical protein